MTKKNLLRLSAMFFWTLMVCACAKQTEYTNVIPTDAKFVASANLQALGQKADLESTENQAILQKLTEALKSEMSATAFQQVERLLNTPSESGIDFSSPVYVFATSNVTAAIAAKVNDENKLVSLLQAAEKEQALSTIQEGNGYKYCTASEQNLIAFTPGILLITSCDNASDAELLKDNTEAMLAQTAETSLSSNAGFQRIMQKKSDISLYMPFKYLYDSLADIYSDVYAGIAKQTIPNADYMQHMIMLADLTFENGEMRLTGEQYTEDPKTQEIIDKSYESLYPIENKYLSKFPQSTLTLFSFGINGEKYLELLQENKELMEKLTAEQLELIKLILNLFDGEITGGLTGIDLRGGMPLFTLYGDAKDEQTFDHFCQQLIKQGLPLAKINEHEYSIGNQRNSISLGINGKTLYLTNDKANFNKEQSTPATNNAYASDIQGKNGACVIDINAICAMPIVQTMAQFGGNEAQMYVKLCQKLDYLICYGEKTQYTISLKLKDKQTNSLKQIVDESRALAGM